MNEQDFILKIMKNHELPSFNRLTPDYEYCTIELQTRDMKDIFVLTVTKKKSVWKDDDKDELINIRNCDMYELCLNHHCCLSCENKECFTKYVVVQED